MDKLNNQIARYNIISTNHFWFYTNFHIRESNIFEDVLSNELGHITTYLTVYFGRDGYFGYGGQNVFP